MVDRNSHTWYKLHNIATMDMWVLVLERSLSVVVVVEAAVVAEVASVVEVGEEEAAAAVERVMVLVAEGT